MALEGTIKDFGLPDIFQLIGLQRKTGLLTLKHDKENVTVTFESGQVVMADSAAKRLEDRLGNVLVKQGKLTKEKLDEALQTQKATLQRLGHILTTGNYITPKDLKDALQVQVSQIVFRVFRWRDGEYHFAPTDNVDFDRDNFTPMSADFILMEGIRMVDEWPIIEKKIPSMDIVFRTVVDPSLIEVAGGSGGGVEEVLAGMTSESKRSAASSASKIRLTPEEERIYRKVDGTRTVQGVIDSTGGGEFEVCRILFDLLNRNIITPVGRGPTREASVVGLTAAAPSVTTGYIVAGLGLLIALGGIFVRRETPFAVTGLPPVISTASELVREAASHSRLDRLDRAILAYHLVHGTAPATLEVLVGEGLVDRSYLHDPWDRPYHYALTENGYLLSGVGDSGKTAPGTVVERSLPVEKR
jgi:hypothetical protein